MIHTPPGARLTPSYSAMIRYAASPLMLVNGTITLSVQAMGIPLIAACGWATPRPVILLCAITGLCCEATAPHLIAVGSSPVID